jgi:SAM-dependent methyltransferase
MVTANTGLSSEDAERFRSFERKQHDSLAATYHDFFTPVATLVIKPLPETVRLHAAAQLLDVATGPGSIAAEAKKRGARPIGIDISPGMIALAASTYPGVDFRVAEVEHLPFAENGDGGHRLRDRGSGDRRGADWRYTQALTLIAA